MNTDFESEADAMVEPVETTRKVNFFYPQIIGIPADFMKAKTKQEEFYQQLAS